MDTWGKHYLIDARTTDIELIKDQENIKKFVADLVVKIDMVPYGECWIDHFATHDPLKSGISFCQMIETSNITGHFVDLDGTFYLDIFSCKDFDENTVNQLLVEYFGDVKWQGMTVARDANMFLDD